MKKFIKLSLEFIVNSNFWIAIATVCFYQLSLLQINESIQLNNTSIFLFFSTLFVYNFFRILSPKEDCKNWYSKNYSYTKALSFLSFIGMLVGFYFIDKTFLYIIVIAALLSFLYASPFIKIGEKGFNLRKYWFLKSIIVAFVWVLLTSVLPLLEFNINNNKILLFSLEKFLFILGITIPYDIKDLKEDKYVKLNTFALKFGVKTTKTISNYILTIALILALFIHSAYYLQTIFIYLLAIFLNYKLNENNSEFWYTFFIDGTIILYFLLVFYFN